MIYLLWFQLFCFEEYHEYPISVQSMNFYVTSGKMYIELISCQKSGAEL